MKRVHQLLMLAAGLLLYAGAAAAAAALPTPSPAPVPTPSPLSPAANTACLECHASPRGSVPANTYGQSPHVVLSCQRCHAEAAGAAHAANPNTPLGLPAGRAAKAAHSERCLKCHAAVMSSYAKSFHGTAVSQGDLRAATCVDCHGIHGIFGAADSRSRVNPGQVASTCGAAGCHPGAPSGFANGREHFDPSQPGTGSDGVLHLVWKFFIGLILFDVMKDGPIVMFELLRRIRG